MKTLTCIMLMLCCFFVITGYCFAESIEIRPTTAEAQKIMPAVGPKGPDVPPTYGTEIDNSEQIDLFDEHDSALPATAYDFQIGERGSNFAYRMKWDTARKVLTLISIWRAPNPRIVKYEYDAKTGDIAVWELGEYVGTYSLPYCGEKKYNEQKQYLTNILNNAQAVLDSGNAVIWGGVTPEQAQQDIDNSENILATPPLNPPVLTPGDYTIRSKGGSFRVTETPDILRVQEKDISYEFNRKTGYITVVAPGGGYVAKPRNKKLYNRTAQLMKYLFALTAKAADTSNYAAVTNEVKHMNLLFRKEVNKFIRRKK